MIINFNNLGGGGGGSYTLPVATASRLGGVKIGSGLDITAGGVLSVTGGSSSDGQKLWTAATPADMAALTGVSEGDVCVVDTHYGEMPDGFYNGLGWGWNFQGAFEYAFNGSYPAHLRATLVENQYWDGLDESTPDGFYTEAAHSEWDDVHQTDIYTVIGLRCENGNYEYVNELEVTHYPESSAYTAFSGVGDSIIADSSKGYNGSSSNGGDALLMEYSNNTGYKYAIRIEQEVAQTTYQYNNGEWMKLASADDVSSAMTLAQQAYDNADGKVSKYTVGLGVWSSITYYDTFIGEVEVDSVNQGYRIHVPGASTERENPKVTELVTSGDVAKIVALTQDEYDQMQTHDNNTLYAIIPDTN